MSNSPACTGAHGEGAAEGGQEGKKLVAKKKPQRQKELLNSVERLVCCRRWAKTGGSESQA
jgi:hypothetical protein